MVVSFFFCCLLDYVVLNETGVCRKDILLKILLSTCIHSLKIYFRHFRTGLGKQPSWTRKGTKLWLTGG